MTPQARLALSGSTLQIQLWGRATEIEIERDVTAAMASVKTTHAEIDAPNRFPLWVRGARVWAVRWRLLAEDPANLAQQLTEPLKRRDYAVRVETRKVEGRMVGGWSSRMPKGGKKA